MKAMICTKMNLRGFSQPLRAVDELVRTNTKRIRPEVIRMAPIQSMRLSSSVEGSSSPMAKYPKSMHTKETLENKYKEVRHVGLQRSQIRTDDM